MPGGWEERSRRRARILVLLLAGWLALIVGRLIQLQVFQHGYYREISDQRTSGEVEISARRGTIFDRNGRPLALSLPAESVVVNPKLAPEPQVTAGILAPVLGLDQRELEMKLADAAQRGRGFLWIKRRVSFAESERLRGLRFGWIELRPESLRAYPKGILAAHVLGSVNFEEHGDAGIEQSLEIHARNTRHGLRNPRRGAPRSGFQDG